MPSAARARHALGSAPAARRREHSARAAASTRASRQPPAATHSARMLGCAGSKTAALQLARALVRAGATGPGRAACSGCSPSPTPLGTRAGARACCGGARMHRSRRAEQQTAVRRRAARALASTGAPGPAGEPAHSMSAPHRRRQARAAGAARAGAAGMRNEHYKGRHWAQEAGERRGWGAREREKRGSDGRTI